MEGEVEVEVDVMGEADVDLSGSRSERFGYWNGYLPARRAADGSLIPLTADELRDRSARFMREADSAERRGDLHQAQRLRRASAIFEERSAHVAE